MVRALSVVLLLGLLTTLAPPATAVTISRIFVEPGQFFPSTTDWSAEGPHPVVTGDGNLIDIFNAAADMWGKAIGDDYELTLAFGWNNRPRGVLGSFLPWAVDAVTKRMTLGFVFFDNDDPAGFYLDPNPQDHAEFPLFNKMGANNDPLSPVIFDLPSEVDLGAGPVNASRLLTGGPGIWGAQDMFLDLFSLALHEIGHAFVPGGHVRLEGDILITNPRPHAGSIIPIDSDGFHLFVSDPDFGRLGTVMNPGLERPGIRRVLSDVDILAAAQLGQFTELNFDVLGPAAVVPEPATRGLFGLALAVAIAGHGWSHVSGTPTPTWGPFPSTPRTCCWQPTCPGGSPSPRPWSSSVPVWPDWARWRTGGGTAAIRSLTRGPRGLTRRSFFQQGR